MYWDALGDRGSFDFEEVRFGYSSRSRAQGIGIGSSLKVFVIGFGIGGGTVGSGFCGSMRGFGIGLWGFGFIDEVFLCS